MEEEREERGGSTESETTFTQVDTQAKNNGEDTDKEPQNPQDGPGEDGQAGGGDCDGEVGKDLSVSDAGTAETVIATNTQLNADCLPLSPMLTEEDESLLAPSSHPSITQNGPPGPCWYCLMSLDSEYRPETPKQEDSDPLSPQPSSGQKVSYQTDPRPHFGVAWSSHSTSHPLWGSEGPSWGQRSQEVLDQTHSCPHCHLCMPMETLRWHEAKCLVFDELRNAKK